MQSITTTKGHNMTSNVVYLFSVARQESDGQWVNLLQGTDRRTFITRLAQDGIERRDAERWAKDAAQSAFGGKLGDMFTNRHITPGRSATLYRVQVLGVGVPSLVNA